MKTGALPKKLDLRGLAAREVHIECTVSSQDLPRLADSGIAIADSGSAAFDFRRDEEARYVVAVCVEAKVVMQCQRCLSDMDVLVKSASLMALVWTDEEAAGLPAGCSRLTFCFLGMPPGLLLLFLRLPAWPAD